MMFPLSFSKVFTRSLICLNTSPTWRPLAVQSGGVCNLLQHSSVGSVHCNRGYQTVAASSNRHQAGCWRHSRVYGCSCCSNYSSSSSDDVTSRQLIIEEYGEPHKVVKMTSTTLPALKQGEVLVKMLAATINPSDINTIQGMYAVKPSLPCVLGNEGVGEVLQAGAGGSLQVGDKVVPVRNAWGTWRSHAVAPAEAFIKIPADMPLVSAATMFVNPATAYRMLRDFVPLKEGDTVIQNAGNSAVGRAVIQLCKHYGYRSVSVVRNRPTIDQLKQELTGLGADVVVTEEELRTNRDIRRMPKSCIALNCVSGKSGAELLRHLRDSGVMVTYGGMARQPVTVPVGSLIFNDVRLVGYWQTRWSQNPDNVEARSEMIADLCELMKNGVVTPPPHKLVKFEAFMTAIEDAMPSEGQVGAKQILTFD